MALNIRIILIQTWHPGNIGAVARAMKNMGLSELILVNPVDFPSDEAYNRAGQATDVLDQARVVASLREAIDDCILVVGTSARDRSIRLPAFSTEQCAAEAISLQKQAPVAIVFGRERMGLHNDDIQQCHAQLNIDANPDYPVLNLSQAVQLVCYEIFKANRQRPRLTPDQNDYPPNEDLNRFYDHLEETLDDIGFINTRNPGQTLEHLRALYRRARPTTKELRLLRGMLSKTQDAAGERKNP